MGEITKIKKKEARKIKEMSKFKAKPVNMKVLDSKVYDKVEEEHLYRKIKGKLRKEELFFTSSLPPRMRSNRRKEMERREEKIEKARREQEFSHKPVASKMPDFDKLQKRNEKRRKHRRGVRAQASSEIGTRHHVHTHVRRNKRENEREKQAESRERLPRYHGDTAALLVRQERRRKQKQKGKRNNKNKEERSEENKRNEQIQSET